MAGIGMLSFHEWSQPGGVVTTWKPTAAALVAAREAVASPVPPSHQQRQHVRAFARYREQGLEMARLTLMAWTESGVCDTAAMTQAINAHVRRHDTYASRFVLGDDHTVERRVIPDRTQIAFEPRPRGLMAWEDWRTSLLGTPGPLEWDCFSFHVVQYDDSFMVCACLDHLNVDGRHQVVFSDIHDTYATAVAGRQPPVLTEPSSYLEYCQRQAVRLRALTPECDELTSWVGYLRPPDSSARLPLPVGDVTDTTNTTLSSHVITDAAGIDAFRQACVAVGSRFIGGVLAVVAQAWTEIAGTTAFRAITPTADPDDPHDPESMGWRAGVVPVVFPVAGSTMAQTMLTAQATYATNRSLGAIPYEAACELLGEDGAPDAPDWSAPLIALHDYTRDDSGNETVLRWRAHHGTGMPIPGASGQIAIWFIRDDAGAGVIISCPDTAPAQATKQRLVRRIAELVHEAAELVPEAAILAER